ncbi:MAG: Crp/Fnr family transcriptional regulator [Acidobacteria bacterium]|nr:Crp/Fnr family transcriptional regulator [Acidobacteriota bacterium]
MKAEQIRKVPLFSTLTDEEFNALQHIFIQRSYRRNQIIFMEEETGNYMYLVLTGKVKVAKSTSSGRETILAIHKAGDFFGEMSLLDGKTSPATVSAMEDSKIISVSGTDFHKYLMNNEKVLLQIINVLCTRLRQVWQKQSLSSSKADARIRMGIYDLAQRHGVQDAHGTIIDLKITHQELSEMVGTSRETVTRVIARLREEGILEVDQRRMTLLDPQALLKE